MTPRAPVKSHRVPKAWAFYPSGFWDHVAACPACSMYYQPPSSQLTETP